MTSKDITNYVEVEGLDKLLAKFINCQVMLDKWSDILAPRASYLTKNVSEPGVTISKPDEVTEDLEPILA